MSSLLRRLGAGGGSGGGGPSRSPSSSSRSKILSRGDACWSCRRRKLRCDSSKPICGPCAKYQRPQECIYDEKPLTEVQILEARVDELERLLQNAISSGTGSVNTTPNTSIGPASQVTEAQMQAAIASPEGFSVPSQPTTTFGGTPGPGSGAPRTWSESSEFSMGNSIPRSSLALFTSSGDTTAAADADAVIPPGVESTLLQIFFAHIHLFHFGLSPPLFTHALSHPPSSPLSPSPALLNALFCLSAHFSLSPTLRALEPVFHGRALRARDEALARVDRLVEVLVAEGLLAQYHLVKGNLARGSYLASSAMSFAAGCGLHQMSQLPPSGSSGLGLGAQDQSASASPSDSLLPPPANIQEYAERVNIFSHVFQIERHASLISGVPLTLPDELITTPWPLSPSQVRGLFFSAFRRTYPGPSEPLGSMGTLEELPIPTPASLDPGSAGVPGTHGQEQYQGGGEQMGMGDLHLRSVASLYDFVPDYPDLSAGAVGAGAGAGVEGDEALLSVSARATALLERATRQARLASTMPFADSRFWESYTSIDQAITRFQASLPPLDANSLARAGVLSVSADSRSLSLSSYPSTSSSLSLGLGSHDQSTSTEHESESEELHRLVTILCARISSLAAQIQLHGIFADRDRTERDVVGRAAGEIGRLVRGYGGGAGEDDGDGDGTPTGLQQASAAGSGGSYIGAPAPAPAPGAAIGAVSLPNFRARRLHMMIGSSISLAAHVLLGNCHRTRQASSFHSSAGSSRRSSDSHSSTRGDEVTVLRAQIEVLRTALGLMAEFYPGLQREYDELNAACAASA